jgi:hypothetical protein
MYLKLGYISKQYKKPKNVRNLGKIIENIKK